MKSHLAIAGFFGAALLVSSSDASAAGHANGLGEKGQLILSADRLLPVFSYTSASVTRTDNNLELTDSKSGAGLSLMLGRNLAIVEDDLSVPVNVHTIPRVAFDISIIQHLTLGAGIAFGFGLGGTNEDQSAGPGGTVASRKTDAPTATAIGLVPRIGYVIPLSDIFAFWPRLGFGFYSVSGSRDLTQATGVTTIKATDTLFSLDIDPQFAIVPVEHFFILVGPLINVPISGSRSVSTTTGTTTNKRSDDASLFHFGLTAGIGGWLNVF